MFNLNLKVMKVVKFFSIALVSSFIVASSVFAADSDKSNAEVKAAEKVVREQLASALSSVSAETETESVYVYFTVSSKGGFELNGVAGANAELTNKVKETLSAKSIATPAILDGKYLIKVRFENR
jgi:hypothetical protein